MFRQPPILEGLLYRSAYGIRPIGYADLLERFLEGVGQDAFFQFDNSAPRWEPLKKLDEVERIERPTGSKVPEVLRREVSIAEGWTDEG